MFSHVSAWPKYKGEKNLYHHLSFQSICSRFSRKNCIMPQYLTIDLKIHDDCNSNKNEFIIDSKSFFIPLNIIILVCYLTNFKIKKIKKLILNGFESDEITRVVSICCYDANKLLEDNSSSRDEIDMANDYIDSKIKPRIKEKDKKKTIGNIKNELINNFLPHLTIRKKGTNR